MLIQLTDFLWPEGQTIEIFCSACGRRLGRYFADEVGERVVLVDGKSRHRHVTEARTILPLEIRETISARGQALPRTRRAIPTLDGIPISGIAAAERIPNGVQTACVT
jgi:hypothetical protein